MRSVAPMLVLLAACGRQEEPGPQLPPPSQAPPTPVMAPARTIAAHRLKVYSLAFTPDGRFLLSAGSDTTVRLWSIPEGREIRSLPQGGRVAFTDTGRKFIAADGESELKIFSTETFEKVATGGPAPAAWTAAFSPDGRFLVTGGMAALVWSAQDLAPVRELEDPFEAHWVAFSGDGKRLASLHGLRRIRVWDTTDFRQLASYDTNPFPTQSVALNRDGSLLASSTGETVWVWKNLQGPHLLKGHGNTVTCVAISPDDRLIASGGFDHTVRLWDARTFQPVAILRGHTDEVHAIAFSPNGRMLASGGSDGTIRIWTFPTELTLTQFHCFLPADFEMKPAMQRFFCLPRGATGTFTLQIMQQPPGASLTDPAFLRGYADEVVKTARVRHRSTDTLRENDLPMAILEFEGEHRLVHFLAQSDQGLLVWIWEADAANYEAYRERLIEHFRRTRKR